MMDVEHMPVITEDPALGRLSATVECPCGWRSSRPHTKRMAEVLQEMHLENADKDRFPADEG